MILSYSQTVFFITTINACRYIYYSNITTYLLVSSNTLKGPRHVLCSYLIFITIHVTVQKNTCNTVANKDLY